MLRSERLIEIESKPLRKGNGTSIDTACVMNMVAYVAGEPWSDHPKCACPTLTKMAIELNDRMDDEQRQKLAPLIPLIVGTRGTIEDRQARANFIVWRNITDTFPILLDLIGMTEYADELRLTPQTAEGFLAADKTLREKRATIRIATRSAASNTASLAADAAASYASYAAYEAYCAIIDDDVKVDYATAAGNYASAATKSASKAVSCIATSHDKNSINDSAIETLRLACYITGNVQSQ